MSFHDLSQRQSYTSTFRSSDVVSTCRYTEEAASFVASEHYKMLNSCLFLNFEAQVAFSRMTLAKDELPLAQVKLKYLQRGSPCQGGCGTEELLGRGKVPHQV